MFNFSFNQLKNHLTVFLIGIILFSCENSDDNPLPQQIDNDNTTNTPQITSFSPDTTGVGGKIEIIGQNFSTTISNNIVKINNAEAKVISATESVLVVEVLENTSTGNIEVTVDTSSTQSTNELVIVSDFWAQRTNFPGQGRQHGVSFEINGKLYFGTGQNVSQTFSDFWEYNPSNDTWTQKTDFGGGARYDMVAFVIDGKAYVGTGQTGSSFEKDFWEYDPSNDTWTQKADFGGEARDRAFAFAVNSKGYIGGGTKGSGTANILKDFWEYDPSNDTWIQKNDFGSSGRHSAVSFVINDIAYVGTGFTETSQYSSELWQYNSSNDTWTQKASLTGDGRFSALGAVVLDKGYILTGLNSTSNFLNDVWQYDPINNNWTRKNDFSGTGREGTSGASVNNMLFLFTGRFSSSYMNDTYRYIQ